MQGIGGTTERNNPGLSKENLCVLIIGKSDHVVQRSAIII
jgi:hypothetical protein